MGATACEKPPRRWIIVAVPRHSTLLALLAAALVACDSWNAPLAQDTAFTVTEIARFDRPWAMAFLPDGRLLVSEKRGALRLFDVAGGSSAVAGVPAVSYGGQGGFGDIVLHPDFAANALVYLSYAEAGGRNTHGAAVARARLVLDGARSELTDLEVIWRQVPKVTGRGHFGHRIAFGPDGYLWISSGERRTFDLSQDPQSNLGKIVRLNDDGSLPPGNPFAGSGGVASQIWSLGHRNPLGLAFDACNYALLLVLSLSIIYPFWNLFLTSFSPVEEVTSLGMHLWIDRWTVSSWGFVLQENDVLQAYLNTIHRVVFGTLTTLLITFSGAYALAKRDLPGRGTITTLFIFTLWFGGGLIPTYLLIRSLGMINSRWVLILPVALNVYYIVIARNFMMTIDQSLEDSAIIDGAGYWTILFRIVLPVSKPVLATIALWAAVSHWNAWFDALIYLNDADKRVLQMLVRDMIQLVTFDELLDYVEDLPVKEHIPPQSVRAVTILITIGPIVMVYPFIQKYFVKGVMLGSLKG